jgi:hypothetical protein
MAGIVTSPATVMDSRLLQLTLAVKGKFDRIFGRLAPSVTDYGAVGDGVTDDRQAFINAIASGARIIEIPARSYRLSGGITIPAGVLLLSAGIAIAGSSGGAGAASFGGANLIFDNAVAVCVTLGAGDNSTAGLRGVTISRAGGAPPAGSIGLRVYGAQSPALEDIYCHNHAIGYHFQAVGTGGISIFVSRVFSAAITDAHWVIDGWPEVRATHCRFGQNGAIDTNCNAYIRIKGGGAGSGSGPNTVVLDNCQFNMGNGAVANTLIEIRDITQAAGVFSHLRMTDCYAENFNIGISTDTTVLSLRRVNLKGCGFNATGGLTNPVHLSLNAATVINEWELVGNEFFGSDFTISSRTINGLAVVGNRFACPVSVTAGAASNSTATFAANTYLNGGLTVAGATGWQSLSVVGDVMQVGSSLTNTAGPAKNVTVAVPGQSIKSWTPALSFGGDSTGITYNIQSGSYQAVGNIVLCEFRIQLTSKGAAVGAAAISAPPIPYNTGLFQTGGGGLLTATNALSTIAGPIIAQHGAGGVIKLLTQGAAATASLTNSNFTNTSEIAGHIVYFL